MSKRLCVGALVALAATLMAAPQGKPAAAAANQPSAAKQPAVKSPAEGQALQAVFSQQDPDARLKAAENFIVKYADSDYKGFVLMMMAETYRQKNDYDHLLIYADRALEADPKSYISMLMVANAMAQHTREFDLDREEKLGKVESYARKAMELVAAAPKPRPDITDDQWKQAQGAFMSQAHEALGMAAGVRKNYDGAIQEFQASLSAANPPDPSTMVRLAAAYTDSKKYDDAVALLDKAIASPQNDPQTEQVRRVAQSEKRRAMQLKARDAKPAAPAPQAAPGAPVPQASPMPSASPAPAPAEPSKP